MKNEEFNVAMDAIGQGPKAINTTVIVMDAAEKAGYTLDDLREIAAFWSIQTLQAHRKDSKKKLTGLPKCRDCGSFLNPYPVPEELSVIYRCCKCKYSYMAEL